MVTKSTGSKQVVKTFETSNFTLAIGLYRRYNSDKLPTYEATIVKKKGGDNFYFYIVTIYSIFAERK